MHLCDQNNRSLSQSGLCSFHDKIKPLCDTLDVVITPNKNSLRNLRVTSYDLSHHSLIDFESAFELELFVVCFSHFLPLERLGGLESHVKVAMV